MTRDDWPTIQRLLGAFRSTNSGIDSTIYCTALRAFAVADVHAAVESMIGELEWTPTASQIVSRIRALAAAARLASHHDGYDETIDTAIGVLPVPPWFIDGRLYWPIVDTLHIDHRRQGDVVSGWGSWDHEHAQPTAESFDVAALDRSAA